MTEIQLDKNKSTLIVGSNGAGKSTVLDALCFALFGKPFRDINKPQLVNSITGKKLRVEVEFSIAKKRYKIVRGIKPNIFEIYVDNQLINQDAGTRDYQEYLENNILKMNQKTFGQIVVLGSANFVPFMQLKAQHRKEVLEDLLDIGVFSTMHVLCKQYLTDIRKKITDVEHRISLVEQEIRLHKEHMEDTRKNNDKVIQAKREKIDTLVEKKKQLVDTNARLGRRVEKFKEQLSNKDKLQKAISTIKTKIAQVESQKKSLEDEIRFLHDHDNCPTCKQEIAPDHREHVTSERGAKVEKADEMLEQLSEKLSELETKWDRVVEIQDAITNETLAISQNNTSIQSIETQTNDLECEIKTLENEGSHSSNKADKLVELNETWRKAKKKLEDLTEKREVYDLANKILNTSGVKTKIIKQYIPVINKLINKYLAAMDFYVQFELDENFNETIKSRFRDTFTYASFSEGEKARLDLALMFAWRAIAKMRNSAATNLLVMDEVFDGSLDDDGNTELMSIINEIIDGNVFVISHKGDQLFDSFERVIQFEKNGNFSKAIIPK